MDTEYDVVVVGGGPAGSIAALEASKGGASVLLLEKDRDIGYPVRCAEAVGAASLKQFVEPDDRWVASRITAFRLISPEGTSVETDGIGEVGYVLERRIFDYELARMASEEGAQVLTKAYAYDLVRDNGEVKGVKVKYIAEEVEFRSRIVIGADGIESRVGRWAGLRTSIKMKDMESAIQITMTNINVNPECCDFYFGKNYAPGGYLWVFPKGAHTANVGLGVSGAYTKEKSPRRYLDEFVQETFPDGAVLTTVVGGVPCAKTLRRISGDGIMLVGDAAHQCNPVSGGGITSGMHGGRIAGRIAAEAVRNGDWSAKALARYDKEWHDLLGKSHERSYRLKMAIMKISDDDLNKTAKVLLSVPSEKRTLRKIFLTALVNQPKLFLDVVRYFVTG